MNDNTSFDIGSLIGTLMAIVATMAFAVHLGPAVRQTAWEVLPVGLMIWLIVTVPRSLLKKLLD